MVDGICLSMLSGIIKILVHGVIAAKSCFFQNCFAISNDWHIKSEEKVFEIFVPKNFINF